MTTAAQLLDVARSTLGVVEGPGPNNVSFNTWFYSRPVVGENFAWCDVWVQWVAATAGAAGLFPAPRSAYCPTSANGWRALGRWSTTPTIGAQVFYRWPGMDRVCHTGLVEAIRPDGIVAIEGNTDVAGGGSGGRVMRQVRRANIAGYGHPAYADSPRPPAPVLLRPPASAAPAFLQVDGQLGPQTIRALQGELGVGVDGVMGPQTIGALQRRLGTVVDGQLGRLTVSALQRRVGALVDGTLGPQTVRALQGALNAHRF